MTISSVGLTDWRSPKPLYGVDVVSVDATYHQSIQIDIYILVHHVRVPLSLKETDSVPDIIINHLI